MLGIGTVLKSAFRFLDIALREDPLKWRPLLSVYYLTYRCDFRCPYCCDGEGRPYYSLNSPSVDVAQVDRIWAAIRKNTEFLVVTGGEPLKYPDFDNAIRRIRKHRFSGVVLTTNGLSLEKHLDAIDGSVTELVVSVDTLNQAKAEEWHGIGRPVLDEILFAVDSAATRKGRSYRMVLSSVVTPKNIEDLYDVCEWAWKRDIWIAAAPQLVGVKAHPALIDNQAYRQFYDFLITRKREGYPVQGAIPYLEGLRDFIQFECRPFTMLVVEPNGEVFYPCLELGHRAGNLLEHANLDEILAKAVEKFGPKPDCGRQCHSACALGFATLFAKPWSILGEGYCEGRRLLRSTIA